MFLANFPKIFRTAFLQSFSTGKRRESTSQKKYFTYFTLQKTITSHSS